jgi:hypothetical protein
VANVHRLNALTIDLSLVPTLHTLPFLVTISLTLFKEESSAELAIVHDAGPNSCAQQHGEQVGCLLARNNSSTVLFRVTDTRRGECNCSCWCWLPCCRDHCAVVGLTLIALPRTLQGNNPTSSLQRGARGPLKASTLEVRSVMMPPPEAKCL